MPAIDIPSERCQQIQQKLRNILQSSPDPDIDWLLETIDSACFAVVSTRSKRKRTASESSETVGYGQEGAKPTVKARGHNAHNRRSDGRKRGLGDDARHKDSTATADERGGATSNQGSVNEHGQPVRDTEVVNHRGLIAAKLCSEMGANIYGWDNDSELSSVPSDSDAEDPTTADFSHHQKPRRQIAKVNGKEPKLWETVDDVRKLTDKAAILLQSIAQISDRSNMSRLVALKEILSSQVVEPEEPTMITLPVLLQRCERSDLKVVESQFKHMVNLMRLSLWLD